MRMKHLFLGALLVFAPGCASKLRVWNADKEVSGIPFNVPVVFIKEFDRDRHSKFGENCAPTHVVQTVSLPLGERFYANVDPAQFAKTGFGMHFADNGSLSQVTLNTEPSGGDNIRAVTEALTSVASLAGIGPRTGVDDPRSAADTRPGCDMGETNVSFRKFNG